MRRIDYMIKWVLEIIASKKYKYSQDADKRWGNGYYDCSSLMITALKQINVDVHGATYTGNMANIGYSPDVTIYSFGAVPLQKGDILYYHKSGNIGHTAMYIGNNQIAHASGTKTGLVVSPYYTGSWQRVIRVTNNYVWNYAGIEEFLDRLYRIILNREPDVQGKNWWVERTDTHKLTTFDIVLGFFNSAEVLNKKWSDSEFLDILYKVFFDREPDAVGKDWWIDQLNRGLTREEVVKGFSQSNEWKQICSVYGLI